jgi:hypothetical protein
MRIPKLGRSGRNYLREVTIIIVGVLIALALEQLASSMRDRARTRAIQASMNEEIADFAEVFSIRQQVSGCINAKLDALDDVLRRNGARGPWRNVGRAPFYFSSRGSWNSDASDLLSRHLGPERLRIYGEVYQGMEQVAALQQPEQDHWVALQTLERQDEPISGERRWHLVEAAAGARNANLLLTAIADQMLANSRRLGVERNRTLSAADISGRAICQPLAVTRI